MSMGYEFCIYGFTVLPVHLPLHVQFNIPCINLLTQLCCTFSTVSVLKVECAIFVKLLVLCASSIGMFFQGNKT